MKRLLCSYDTDILLEDDVQLAIVAGLSYGFIGGRIGCVQAHNVGLLCFVLCFRGIRCSLSLMVFRQPPVQLPFTVYPLPCR